MNIDGTTIYWLTRLDAVNTLGVVCVFFGLIVLTAAVVVGAIMRSDGDEAAGLRLHVAARRWIWIIPAFGAAVTTFVPTTREAAAIIVIPAVANSEDVRGLGADVVTLAREWIEELKPKETDK